MFTGLTGSDIPAQETGGAFKFWSENEPHLSIWVFRFGDYHMPMVFRDRQSWERPSGTEQRKLFLRGRSASNQKHASGPLISGSRQSPLVTESRNFLRLKVARLRFTAGKLEAGADAGRNCDARRFHPGW